MKDQVGRLQAPECQGSRGSEARIPLSRTKHWPTFGPRDRQVAKTLLDEALLKFSIYRTSYTRLPIQQYLKAAVVGMDRGKLTYSSHARLHQPYKLNLISLTPSFRTVRYLENTSIFGFNSSRREMYMSPRDSGLTTTIPAASQSILADGQNNRDSADVAIIPSTELRSEIHFFWSLRLSSPALKDD